MYLRQTKTILISSLFFLLIAYSSEANAATKDYKSLFSEFDFELCEEGMAGCENSITVIGSSQINNTNFNTIAKNYLVVCDSNYTVDDVSCSPQNISSSSDNLLLLEGSEVNKIYYKYDAVTEKFAVLVPESYLIFHDYTSKLIDFLKIIEKNDTSLSATLAQSGIKNTVKNIFLHPVVELMYSALFIMVIYLMLKPFFHTLLLNPKKLLSSDYFINLLTAFKKNSYDYRHYSVFLLLITLLSYFYSLVFVSILDLGQLDFRYMYSYFSSTLDFSNVRSFLENSNEVRLLYVFANMLVCFLLILSMLPELLGILTDFSYRISKKKFSEKGTVLLITVSLVMMLYDLTSVMVTAFFFGILFLVTIVSNQGSFPVFKKHNKRLYFALAISVLLIFTFLNYKTNKLSQNKKLYLSFDKKQDYIALPLNISVDSRVHVGEMVSQSEPILFADNYLISHPQYDTIDNLPLDYFSSQIQESVAFNFLSREEFLLAIDTNNALGEITESNMIQDLIGFEILPGEDYVLEFNVECARINPRKVVISYYYKNFDTFIRKTLTSFRFVECTDELKQYSYRFNITNIPKDRIFLGFDYLPEEIKSIKLLEKDKSEVAVVFYDYPDGGYLELSKPNVVTIKNYSMQIGSPFSISNSRGTILSDKINNLIDFKNHNGTITVWSPTTNILNFYYDK